MPQGFNLSSLTGLFKGEATDFSSSRDPSHTTKTERSTTVFSGTPAEWQSYLNTPWNQRRSHFLFIDLQLDQEQGIIRFEPRNPESKQWAAWLERGIGIIRKRLDNDPETDGVYQELLFGNDSNKSTSLHLHATEFLPSDATREIQFDDNLDPVETDIVLRSSLVDQIGEICQHLPEDSDDSVVLGTLWPVLVRIISQLGYPSYPRDRFGDRIILTARESFLTLRLLFKGRSKGIIEPNVAGMVYLDFVSNRTGVRKKALVYQVAYFRMLNDLGFLLKDGYFATHQEAVQVIVRDFLDQKYLRISVSGVMPGLLEWMAPMEYTYKKKKKVVTPSPGWKVRDSGPGGLFRLETGV